MVGASGGVEARVDARRTAPVAVPPGVAVVGATLLALACAIAALVAPLYLLEALPEMYAPSPILTVLGLLVAPALAVIAWRTRGVWRERAVLAATMAVATKATFLVPEWVGLTGMNAAMLTLILLLRSGSVRAAATAISMVLGIVIVVPLTSSYILTALLAVLLVPLAAWLPGADATVQTRVLRIAAVASAIMLVASLLEGLQATVELTAVLLASVVAAAAVWGLRRVRGDPAGA